jgi:hypothetical protein
MRNKHEELVQQMNELADWVEKTNNVNSYSAPRWAAITIARLEEENYQMRLQLNKRDVTITDIYNRVIGYIRLTIYLMRKQWTKG